MPKVVQPAIPAENGPGNQAEREDLPAVRVAGELEVETAQRTGVNHRLVLEEHDKAVPRRWVQRPRFARQADRAHVAAGGVVHAGEGKGGRHTCRP